MFQNYMDTVVVNRMPLAPFEGSGYYYFPVKGLGSTNLTEQTLDGYEVGWAGSMAKGRVHAGVTWYLNDSRNDMILSAATFYDQTTPPPGWPLPMYLLPPTGPVKLPSSLQYRNLGQVRNQGFETSVDSQISKYVSFYANYSYQKTPVPKDFDISLINLPPNHRFNAGIMIDYKKILADFSVGSTSQAYFRDILTYAGWIQGFTTVNAGFGVRLYKDNAIFSIKVRNLGNEPVQNHLFSDLLKRQVTFELRLRK